MDEFVNGDLMFVLGQKARQGISRKFTRDRPTHIDQIYVDVIQIDLVANTLALRAMHGPCVIAADSRSVGHNACRIVPIIGTAITVIATVLEQDGAKVGCRELFKVVLVSPCLNRSIGCLRASVSRVYSFSLGNVVRVSNNERRHGNVLYLSTAATSVNTPMNDSYLAA